MPAIYLSPSTQELNPYVNFGTEEEWMNLLADAIEPYLTASGIRYTRNTPEMTALTSIRASNANTYDLHLALHSNALPEDKAGTARGIICFYYPNSQAGKEACTLIANNLKVIYPLPNKVTVEPTTAIGEVRRVKAPSAFLEIGYHDNLDDAVWIQNNIQSLAYVIALGVTEFLKMPFLTPVPLRQGVVSVGDGVLNIRDRPSATSTVLTTAPNGANVTIVNQYENWYVIIYNGLLAWANADFITVLP